MEVVLLSIGIRGKKQLSALRHKGIKLLLILGDLKKICGVQAKKKGSRTGNRVLVSNLRHCTCLCPPFAGQALRHFCPLILGAPVLKMHLL